MDGGLTIGELARRSGVATSALRFYEAKGLIHADRTGSGHRRYLRAALRRIAFIVFAQRVGLSLDELAALLARLPQNRVPDAADWATLADGWSKRIDARIAELERLKAGLTGCIACGCLSLTACRMANPGDRAARRGPGPVTWGGVPASAGLARARPAQSPR
jgi:MerR family redox-sensitive transcriptional activator SoxR